MAIEAWSKKKISRQIDSSLRHRMREIMEMLSDPIGFHLVDDDLRDVSLRLLSHVEHRKVVAIVMLEMGEILIIKRKRERTDRVVAEWLCYCFIVHTSSEILSS
jgi:hypothetical protein